MTSQELSDDDTLAAEFALRLLTGDDLTTAKRRYAEDADFARSVTEWEIKLATMAADLPEEAPGAAAKTAVMARLFGEVRKPSWWQGARIWQGISLACVVLAAAIFFGTDETADTGPLYTAQIATETGDFRVVAVVDKSTDHVILTRTAGAAPPGRILQVWAHGPGAPAMSVGLWPDGQSVRLPLPPTIAAVRGVLTLGVSEEPPGGSTTGAPSGRVFGTVDIPGVEGTF